MSQENIIKTYQGRDPGVSACLVELEGFIGDMDGKTVGTAMDDNTFSDDGTVDASSAVIAINGLIWSLERREAENERLRAALGQSVNLSGKSLTKFVEETLGYQQEGDKS